MIARAYGRAKRRITWLYSERSEESGGRTRELRPLTWRQTLPLRVAQRQRKLKSESRLHFLDLMQAVAKELLAIGVGGLLAQELLGALAGQLAGILRQLMTGTLEAIVDLSPRALQNFLGFGLGGRNQFLFLALAFDFRPLANLSNFFLQVRQAGLNVGGQLIRFRAALACFLRLLLDAIVTCRQRELHRSADQPAEKGPERDHVGQLPDPRRKPEELRTFVRPTEVLARMRSFGTDFFGPVRNCVRRLRLRFLCDRDRRDEYHQQRDDRQPHSGLPRMRSAARRASDSASRTIFSRTSFTSRFRRASASEISVLASLVVRSTSDARCVPASARNLS